MKKVGIVYSGDRAGWISVDQINDDLISSYRNCFEKIIFYNYFSDNDPINCLKLARRICKAKIDRLIFVSIDPHPFFLLRIIFKICPEFKPIIYIHLYGRFIQRAEKWAKLNEFLIGKKVGFICSSLAHKRFVDFFLNSGCSNFVCPSPVNTKMFSASYETRELTRKRLDIKKDDFVIIYAGRISLQKNCILLCREVFKYAKRYKKKIKIILAGVFDDHGVEVFNKYTEEGFFYANWIDFLKTNKLEDNILYVGLKKTFELVQLFNASDCYISLSTYHLDNFGIAPLQALCTGLPAILSHWGGHSSYDDEYCRLIDVSLKNNGIEINTNDFFRKLNWIMDNNPGLVGRKKISQRFSFNYSLMKTSERISVIQAMEAYPFKGFNKKIYDYISEQKKTFSYPLEKTVYYKAFKNFIK